MLKVKRIPWKSQLKIMENIAAASGDANIDSIREAMTTSLNIEFGRDVVFDFEPIPDEKLRIFVNWLTECE